MKTLSAVLGCAWLAVSIAVYADNPPAAKSPDESQLIEHGHYVNSSPTLSSAPEGIP
jgi:hypothetical protein